MKENWVEMFSTREFSDLGRLRRKSDGKDLEKTEKFPVQPFFPYIYEGLDRKGF